jgi:hypothetical protein
VVGYGRIYVIGGQGGFFEPMEESALQDAELLDLDAGLRNVPNAWGRLREEARPIFAQWTPGGLTSCRSNVGDHDFYVRYEAEMTAARTALAPER